MPKRCSDTHFYVSGHKTRSGQAVYTTPDGTELAVVCGRNRPGPSQIHLRDVPNGAALRVTGHGGELDLMLDQATIRGRYGRLLPHEIPDRASESQIVWNNLVELPAHHADQRWAIRLVDYWVNYATPSGDGSFAYLHQRNENAHWHFDVEAWSHVQWSDQPPEFADPDRYAARLCGQVCGMDPTRDRQALHSALRELINLNGILTEDLPPQYHARLVGVLTAQAPQLGYKQLENFVGRVSPALALELVSRMIAPGEAANSTTRAYGHSLVEYLLNVQDTYSSSDRTWLHLGILANAHLAPWHAESAAAGSLPDECVPIAYRLACPAAAELLASRRPDAMVSDTRAAALHTKSLAELTEATRREAERVAARNDAFTLPAIAAAGRAGPFPPDPLPSADRVARAGSVSHDERAALRDWNSVLRVSVSVDKGVPDPEAIEAYLGRGVTSFDEISRLARHGVEPWDLAALDEAGARTTAKKLACGVHDVRGADLAAFHRLGVTDFSEALRLTRRHVTAEWLAGYEALGVHDRAAMVELGELDISPADLAAFRAAGRTLDETRTHAAADVSGFSCLTLTAAGVDDVDTQARLCHIARTVTGGGERYVSWMADTGLTGDELVAAFDRRLRLETLQIAFRNNLHGTELLEGLDAGVPDHEIGAYAELGIRSSRDWAALYHATLTPAKVRLLQHAGVSQVTELLRYAGAPITSAEDAVTCVAALSRAQNTVSSAATALT